MNEPIPGETPTIDCRSPEGITVSLIDTILTCALLLKGRDKSHPAVRAALLELWGHVELDELLEEADEAEAELNAMLDMLRQDEEES